MTMDFLYRSKPPTYQGPGQTQTQTTRNGFLRGLWCSLFGGLFAGTVPTYRTIGNPTSTASGCGSPQYKTPPEVAPGDPCPESPPTSGEPTGEDCSCEPEGYVEPREIHIYPGG
jgi:hypothetical protein